MRNLAKYPVTHNEAIEVLREIERNLLKDDLDNLSCGDMRCTIIDWVIEKLQEHKELTA